MNLRAWARRALGPVTGSRHWESRMTIADSLGAALGTYATIGLPVLVHGGARGADSIADDVWRKWMSMRPGWLAEPEVHRADWAAFGRSAGHRRNAEMVNLGATVCLAFPLGESRGTRGCMRLAAAAGIPVIDHDPGKSVATPDPDDHTFPTAALEN